MRKVLIILLALGACTASDEDGIGNQAEPAVADAARPGQVGAQGQAKVSEPEGEAPAGAFQWTGRFAATEALCRGGVWEFSPGRVETDGETSCVIGNVGEGGGRVELSLACTAEGMNSRETWTLSPSDGGGMSVSRSIPGAETIDVDLLRCD